MAILFLGLSVGFNLNLHYCGGELSDIALTEHTANCSCEAEAIVVENSCCALPAAEEAPKKGCSSDPQMKKNSCCVDMELNIVFEEDLLPASQNEIQLQAVVTTLLVDDALQIDDELVNTNFNLRDHTPPPDEPIWLLTQRLTYYG